MVGYPLIKTADMDNNFDLLCRKIWRKKANQTSPNTYVHPGEGTREYPTLKPTNVNITQIPRYKERESPSMHIEQVSRNVGEHG